MKAIKNLSPAELDALFREATIEAAREAQAAGQPLTGFDENGELKGVEETLKQHKRRKSAA